MKSKKKLSLKEIAHGIKSYLILRKKFLWVLVIFAIFLIIVLFGTKIYLTINLLIGDDSLVRLTASEREVFLVNGESFETEFSTYVSTNPFCRSVCEYEMMDLSEGRIIERDIFYTRISNPNSKSYVLSAPERGAGQKLYRFSTSCLSESSGFCKSSERAINKSFLVALNYGLSEEQFFLRDKAIERLNEFAEEYERVVNLSLENLYLHGILSEKILEPEPQEFNLSWVEPQMDEVFRDFENYDYDFVLAKNINFSSEELLIENSRLARDVVDYNGFVFSVERVREGLINLSLEQNMSEEDFKKISALIVDYNKFVSGLNDSFFLGEKITEAGILSLRLDVIINNLNVSGENSFVFGGISSSGLELISRNFSSDYQFNFSIPNEIPICSYMGVFEVCCDEGCASDNSKYPVILLHGHSFNSGVSAENSLGDLRGIQEELFLDGFLDGGDFILTSNPNSEAFKKTNKRVVFSVSYYFDIYQNSEETIILETQSDNLDTYSLRLNEIIDEVKLETGKEKVVIVAHSMGGLVARKYLQIFGDSDVDRLIMIGTPNKGIDGFVLSTCSVLGENKHCEDMNSESLFLNKLNFGKTPKIPVYNIVGIGCDTRGEDGDGVAKNSSVYLSWANNYYVNGSCEGFDYLHNKMTRPDVSSEAYDLVRGFLG
jgi:hypothetical protein